MSDPKKTDLNEYMSEFIGTFVFLFLGIGCVAGLKLAGAGFGQWEIGITWGVAVAIGVYISAGVSGAHLNPSVTVALAVFGNFEKRKVLPYIAAQTLGAFFAAAVAYFLYHGLFVAKLAAAAGNPAATLSLAGSFCTFPNPEITLGQAFCTELIITAVLMGAIMAITDNGNGVPAGPMAPLAIGLLVAVIGACFGPLTGFAMNAARDFGPRLFAVMAGWGTDALTGYPINSKLIMPYFIVPLTAPIIGACLGAWIYKATIAKGLRDKACEAQDENGEALNGKTLEPRV